MNVVILLVFISVVLVGAALVFFLSRLRGGDFDHGDRLSLLPLQDDDRDCGEPPRPANSEEEDSVDGSR